MRCAGVKEAFIMLRGRGFIAYSFGQIPDYKQSLKEMFSAGSPYTNRRNSYFGFRE
jgi:hypothetical protein